VNRWRSVTDADAVSQFSAGNFAKQEDYDATSDCC